MVWLGVVLALATSVSWAIGNVLTQRLGKLVGAPRAMLWALGAGFVLAVPLALLLDERSAPFSTSVAVWIGAASVAGVIAYIGLFHAFANEGLTVAVPLVSSWPLVASVIAIAFFGESLRGPRLFGAGAVLVGVVLVSIPRRLTRGPGARGALVAALGSSVGFGVMVPAMGRIAPATGAFGATATVYAVGIFLALVVGRIAGISLRPPPRSAWGLVFATGAVETIGFVTVALARRYAPTTLVAPVASLSATITVLYAWVALRERPRALAIAGALLAGVGVAILAS